MSVTRRTNLLTWCAALVCACGIVRFAIAAAPKEEDATKVATKAMAEGKDVAAAADGMSVMSELVGEWKIDAKWTAGNDLHARAVYEFGVGKKFVNARTFVTQDDGTEYQRYLNVFGVKDGKLTCWNYTFDGSTDISDWNVAGKKLSCSKPMKSHADAKSVNASASTSTLHQSIELVEPNKMHWLVAIETDGKTQQIMDGYWMRQASK